MKIMLFAGLILVVLGIASLLVPIPHTEKHGIKAGDVNIGVETTQSERVSPIISVVLIAVGPLIPYGKVLSFSKVQGSRRDACANIWLGLQSPFCYSAVLFRSHNSRQHPKAQRPRYRLPMWSTVRKRGFRTPEWPHR
jgi:hypothetical protein